MANSDYFSRICANVTGRMIQLQDHNIHRQTRVRYLVELSEIVGAIWIRIKCADEYAHPQYHSGIMELHATLTSREFYDVVWENNMNDWGEALKISNEYRYRFYYSGENVCSQFQWYLEAHEEYIAKYFVPDTINTLKCVGAICEDNITNIMEFAGVGSMEWRDCLALVYSRGNYVS
jgi:hypothetical protein